MPLLIDKPTDYTSFDVIAVLRKKLNIKKIGHSGTLDPLATGLLIILVGRSETRQQDSFMGMDKEYIAEITFGATSTTYDAEGELSTSALPANITKEQLEEVLPQFTGDIEQTVPAYSAIKVNGQRLYKLAREGRVGDIKLPNRVVSIYEIEILSVKDAIATIRVHCGKGTYIRSLVHDIGQVLGCGAYLSALRRTKIGDYSVEDALQLGDVTPQTLIDAGIVT